MNYIFDEILKEEHRQIEHLELIASENYVSENVLKAAGSILTNKYAEGYPNKRYYWGCEYVDNIEDYTKKLAKNLFSTNYFVNVQPHSWSSANMAVYLASMNVWDTVLWMSLDAWWHLTHGAFPSFSWNKYKFYNSVSYWLDENWYIDYKEVEQLAIKNKPKLIVAWASAYSRIIDFKKFKDIADKVWAYLLVDMAHIAWLIAKWKHPSPFWIADFVTSTTHKTLRGPRGWIIFSRNEELDKKINSAIFPWLQWWPLMHIIAAKWICFEEALTEKYEEYINQVIKNAKTFEKIFLENEVINNKKINIVSNWTDNHLLLLDFREIWITWKEVSELLWEINITVNKNSVPWDTNPTNPSWIRIWTPAITSRGIVEKDIEKIAFIMINAIKDYIEKKLDEEKKEKYKNQVSDILRWKTIFPKIS